MNIHTAVVNTKDQKILKEKAIKFIYSDSNGAETIFIGRTRSFIWRVQGCIEWMV